MKILLLSRYDWLGASSRVRFFQYIPFLESRGWQIDISPFFANSYLDALYSGASTIQAIATGYLGRMKSFLRMSQYDLVWVEKEVFPFLPALAERLMASVGTPYIVDYDDALFHRYDRHRNLVVRSLLGHKIDAVMRYASIVIAGNGYLAQRAKKAGATRVEIVPTVIDLERYQKTKQHENTGPTIVGWIGSPVTSKYLLPLVPVFKSLLRKFDVRFIAVGADYDSLAKTPIEVTPWSEQSEVEAILGFDVGIMPLPDSPWERGKCGYKLIQYMACGLPVVASPVGVNSEIVTHGENGFLANCLQKWEKYLSRLISTVEFRKNMGKKGRERVEQQYCLQVQAPRLESFLKQTVEGARCAR